MAEAHGALARLSTMDPPTGLPNRLHFEHSLMQAVSVAQCHGRPLTLLRLKLQGLRHCNARHGFLAGDRALQVFAGLVIASLGQQQMGGRLGGVDVAVLLPELEPAGVRLWLAALQARVTSSEPLQAAGLSVGHGLAECLAEDTADQLLLRADAELRRFA